MNNTLSTVVKSNELIEGRYKLSTNQHRLVLLLISIINPEDEDFQDYELRVLDFARMFGIEGDKDVYAKVEEAAEELVGKTIKLSKGKEREFVAWFSYAKYKQGEGVIIIRFDKSLKPYLLQLKSHFTRYALDTVVRFKSQYSIRLYELLKEFEYLGHGGSFFRIIEIDDLKGFLGVKENEYGKMHDMKKRLIEPAIKEISSYSDIAVTQVEYIKEGRTVGSVKFTAEPKAGKALVADEQAMAAEHGAKEPPEHVAALLAFGIAEPMARKWAKQYGQRKIMEACGYVRAKCEAGGIKDIPAYLAKTLEHDYHTAWLAKNAKKEAKQAEEHARKALQEAEEQDRRQRTGQRIADALEAFHALPDAEQERLRDRFAAENPSPMLKSWKTRRANGEQPEISPMFRLLFVDFLGNASKPLPV